MGLTAMKAQDISRVGLVAARVEIKAMIEKEQEDWDNRRRLLKANLAHVENALNDVISAQGQSVYLDDGTCVSRGTNVFVQVDNWDAFDALILQTGNLRLVQKNAGRNAVVDYANSLLPDGVNVLDYFNGVRDPKTLPPFPEIPGVKLSAEYNIKISNRKGTKA